MGKQRNWVPKPDPVTIPVETDDPKPAAAMEPAELARRFGALVVDWILCVLIAGFFASPKQAPWAPSVVLIIEYAFFIGLFAQTPGMFITRIRCVSVHDGGRIGVIPAFIRGVLLAILVPALIMDGQRRGLHDKAASSMMVAMPPKTA